MWSPQGAIDMHRPERWGYLQFSTAKAGDVTFAPDPDWDARDGLRRAYYAQGNYYAKNGRYAAALDDLGLKLPAGRLRVEATRNTYEMSWGDGTGKKPRYTITNDGQLGR